MSVKWVLTSPGLTNLLFRYTRHHGDMDKLLSYILLPQEI